MLRVHGGSCVLLLWSGQQLDDDADYSLSVLLVVFCIILYPTSYAAALPCPALYGGFSCTASGCRALLPVRSVLPCFLAQPLGHKLSQNRAAET